jgi:hypothetical protein
MAKFDKSTISVKREALEKVSAQLKTEFFGLDEIIDKVVKSIHAWYIFPEIITRPVIINLWGMTGVGKTQLVRRLVSLLDYQRRFVEIQMDGGSMKSNHDSSSISKILSESSIDEGQPGILLLDEIQRFRTVNENGEDIKLERFHDVWTLLSDGKFSADASIFQEIEMMIAMQNYHKDYVSIREPDDEEEEKPAKKPRKFKIYPYEANSLKKTLRISETVQEIMKWEPSRVEEELNNFKASRTTWEIDYSKMVIFISGNLDNAFMGSRSTDDCDTDADFYHEETKKISSMDIKGVLRQRFRPEQISRMGNNHIIYPSMSKRSYEKLIETNVNKYLTEMTAVAGINYHVSDDILLEIYNNSVFPTQGTRPVFSSIHMIFSSLLANVTFWAIENDAKEVNLKMSEDHKGIIATKIESVGKRSPIGSKFQRFPVELEMNEKKAKATIDFKTIVAVHEAGHAIVYALLTNTAPLEVKINVSSFNGGYMLPAEGNQVVTKKKVLDKICVYMAGLCAERAIFGDENLTTGAQQDILSATGLASHYVRQLGFDQHSTHINGYAGNVNWVTSIKETDASVTSIIENQKSRATEMIAKNRSFFEIIVNTLISDGLITQNKFIDLAKHHIDTVLYEQTRDDTFYKMWESKLLK